MKADPSHPDQTSVSPNGRPRDPRIDDAVLAAAAELLVERGYARLSLGAIARKAGTTTPAIYRRWPSKAHLVHEVAIPRDFTSLPPASGDLRTDLEALVRGATTLFGTPVARAAFPGLLSEIAHHPELHDKLLERFQTGVFAGLRQRLTLAEHNGQLTAGTDADRVLELVAGAALVRLLLQPSSPVDERWVDQVVDLVMGGVSPRIVSSGGGDAPAPRRPPGRSTSAD